MEFIQELSKFVATLSCGLFAGAAIYVNLVEHPARMKCGIEIAAIEFRPSYQRASVMQATLAAMGLLSAIVAFLAGANIWWIVGGVLLGLVIPFTLIFIAPVNKQLLAPASDKRRSEELLSQWGKLHAVRSILSTIAFIIFLVITRIRM